MDRADIVIVGGGVAAAALVESYRKAGGEGSVTLLTEEPDLPVYRPDLSKEYLRGERDRQGVFALPAEFYRDSAVSVLLGQRAVAIDVAAKQVILATGDHVGYQSLVLATGARPRRAHLPGADLGGVHYLRSLADADRLRETARSAREAVVIGGGFIGMELAGSFTRLGIHCTVLERGSRLFSRIVPQDISAYVQEAVERNGIRILYGGAAKSIDGTDWVEGVTLESGESLRADLVVIGVGASLNTELARAAGLEVNGGVAVDAYLRTSQPDVFAIGDIAAFPGGNGEHLHLEHWDNAVAQGEALARTIAGRPTKFEHIPYFWTNLAYITLFMVGRAPEWDETKTLVNPDTGDPTTIYFKDGRVEAVLIVNDFPAVARWTEVIGRDRSALDLQALATAWHA